MTEPLVTRGKHGIPYLRGTGLAASDVQGIADAGRSTAEIRAQYLRILEPFSDADIERALTYPRVGDRWNIGEGAVVLDDDGDISTEGWFDATDIPAVIAALGQAQAAVEAWGAACDRWETEVWP